VVRAHLRAPAGPAARRAAQRHQLNDYAAPLGGKLVDGDPSFITTRQNAARLAGYGLRLEQVTSSEAAQLAELRRAYERRRPILVYLYHPHWAFEEFSGAVDRGRPARAWVGARRAHPPRVVLVAAVVATAVGVPLGVWAARSRAAGTALRPVLDLMQTTPVFVYLIPAVFFFGIGVVPGVVATTIFSIPPAVRLTELGIRGVDPEVVEAASAFGAHPRQILREVQLPMALPSIMAGINQVIMLALSMVVVAGLAGAGGLGTVVVSAVTQLDIAAGVDGGLAVVILAIFLDRFTAALAQRPNRGLWGRLRSRRAGVAPRSTAEVLVRAEQPVHATDLS
jgi:ABC-type proline/glycine betaine transport system permease subunit